MAFDPWFRSPRPLLASFLAITVVLAGALGWLSWRLLEQDRELEQQRVRDRLETAADVVAGVVARSFADLQDEVMRLASLPDSQLASALQQRNDNGLIAVLNPQSMDAYPALRLPYYPFVAPSEIPPEGTFTAGEILEFQQRDYPQAAAVFRGLAAHDSPIIRGGALLRLARNLRKVGQIKEALAVYDELAVLGETVVDGRPAELWARYERCVLLDQIQQRPALEEEARALYQDLYGGRWKLTRPVFDFYSQATRQWMSPEALATAAVGHDSDSLALANAVDWIWEQWQQGSSSEIEVHGWHSLPADDRSVFLVWHAGPDRLVAFVDTMGDLEKLLLRPLQSLAASVEVVGLTPRDQSVEFGEGESSGAAILRTGIETGLPWNLHLRDSNPESFAAALSARRQLLITVVSLIAAFVVVGGYFGVRSVSRELQVAALQSDFVSAVSHEFRTPLASLRQLSELLADGRVRSEERRQRYYVQLRAESERLQRLVEGLLDFGRMEAGVREYRFEVLDAVGLVRTVGSEFSREVEDRGFEIALDTVAEPIHVRADEQALRMSVWNLLDNAVKYSSGSKTVWLGARLRSNEFEIWVRDEGIGIPRSEQKQIFKKFVRVSGSSADGIPGTGLGLAMVDQIVAAHGGRVLLESKLNEGSTFTIVLPVMEAPA